MEFEAAIERAIKNVNAFGDTDIFPFPFENHIIFDEPAKVKDALLEIDANFEEQFSASPPNHIKSLAPIGYTGFRWATQLDPLWNLYFLALVISIGDSIEQARIPPDEKIVFSYRFNNDHTSASIFCEDYNWTDFYQRSLELAEQYPYVIVCDISEFYPRLSHHRLENALQQVNTPPETLKKIKSFLANFSNTNSYGLPIGGPAARLLSEITINQIDRLLKGEGIAYARFSDDFHLFAKSREEAHQILIYLSEKLYINQGLSLQKSKTRIQQSTEFKNTAPLIAGRHSSEKKDVDDGPPAKQLLRISLRFDPYSPTAEDDYENLKDQLSKFDIIGLLKSELTKSRIHIALSSRIVRAIHFLPSPQKDDAAVTLMQNIDILYPILPAVFVTLHKIFDDLSEEAQSNVISLLIDLIKSQSHAVSVDMNLAYATRLLGKKRQSETEEILQQIYKQSTSPLVRRDIILIMAKWKANYWLSDTKNHFEALGPWERRSFVLASYMMTEEGTHWRDHQKKFFSPQEKLVRVWASARKNRQQNFEVPI